MPTPRTSIRTIALVLQARLVSETGVPSGAVIITAHDDTGDVPINVQDKYIYLRFRGFVPNRDLNEGGGRFSFELTRTLDVKFGVRCDTEPSPDDVAKLTADDKYFVLEEAVLGAFQDWTVRDPDSSHDAIATKLYCVTGGDPGFGKRVNNGWIENTIRWQFSYLPPMDTDVL